MRNMAAAGFVLAVFAACSSGTPTATPPSTSVTPAPASSSAPPARTVGMNDQQKFTPATLTITAGQTVPWMNTGTISHTVTACVASSGCTHVATIDTTVDSGTIAAGTSFQHLFTTPGKFYYYCKIHGAKIMSGLITVT